MSQTFDIDGNRLTLYVTGRTRHEALFALIDGARASLTLVYYIFGADAVGERVRLALIAAADRGVVVRLIIDGFGSNATGNEAFFAPLIEAGVVVSAFIPRWGRRYLVRNHQKLALADEAHALIGGFNVENAYFHDSDTTAWRDLALCIEGPAAARLGTYTHALAGWVADPHARLRTLTRVLRKNSDAKGTFRWLHGGPMRRASPWLRALRSDLRTARDVSIVAAYFVPTPGLTRRIARVAQRGAARVVTAGKTDNLATIGAARFTFPALLRRGVRVFEYQPCRLHTKLVVLDDVVHIGSANLDPRSLFLNVELMLRVEDAGFATAMRAYVEGEIAASRERTRVEFTGVASIPERLRNLVAHFLVAVLDPALARRLRLGSD